MQTELLTITKKIEQITPITHLANQDRQTFDLPEVITYFCNWYQASLAEKNQPLNISSSPDVPRHIQGNRLFMKHLLFAVGKCSLLYTGAGEVGVKIDALQHSRRRHNLTFTISVPGATIPFARKKELFQTDPVEEQRDPRRFRIANLFYAQMIAGSFGGDIHVDDSAESGLRFLVGLSVFTPPS